MFSGYTREDEDEHSSWGLLSCLKVSWCLTSPLEWCCWRDQAEADRGINELLDLPGEQGNMPKRREGKERFEVHRQRQCSVGNERS